jgi:VanZ family protein
MKKYLKKLMLTSVLVLYVLAMIIGAIIPNPQDVPVFSGNTKYFHFFGFIILAIITLKTLELYNFKQKYILSAILLVLFIFLTECLQLLVSTRHFRYTDMLIDALGCIIGVGLYRWIFYRR